MGTRGFLRKLARIRAQHLDGTLNREQAIRTIIRHDKTQWQNRRRPRKPRRR